MFDRLTLDALAEGLDDMENKMREEFEIVAKQKSYDLRRVSYAPDDYSNNGVQAMWVGYQAGRNHPIEVNLEEAAKNFCASCGVSWSDISDEDKKFYGYQAKTALNTFVPNCVVKE